MTEGVLCLTVVFLKNKRGGYGLKLCNNCNNYNDDNVTQCVYCGMPLQVQPIRKKNHTKLIIIATGVFVALLCTIIGIIFVNRNLTSNKYEEKMKKGDRYLAELDYDSAITAYNEALKIDKKNEKTYIKLAEAYQATGDMDSVDRILTLGYQTTGSKTIKRMIDNLVKYASIFDSTYVIGDKTTGYKTVDKEDMDAATLDDLTLNDAFFGDILDKGYTDYNSIYGSAEVKFENGSEVISISYKNLDAHLWYVNEDEQVIDSAAGEPAGNIRPSYIMVDKLDSIIRGAGDSITYDNLCTLFGENPKVKSDQSRNYELFHYKGCAVYLGCTESGDVNGQTTWIKVVVPGAGKNKDEVSAKGYVTGIIVDAVNGQGLGGVALSFREGRQNKSGDIVLTEYTDVDGSYTAELEENTYTVCAELENYQTEYFEVEVTKGNTTSDQNLTMSSILASGEARIVLEWGATPEDLDAHLTGNVGGDSFHVSFRNMSFGDIVNLDVDDRNGFGPETITISDISRGTFTYSVVDYINQGMGFSSSALGNSGATVKVYIAGDDQPRIYEVPVGAGVIWNVFEIRNGEIIDINELTE